MADEPRWILGSRSWNRSGRPCSPHRSFIAPRTRRVACHVLSASHRAGATPAVLLRKTREHQPPQFWEAPRVSRLPPRTFGLVGGLGSLLSSCLSHPSLPSP